MNKLSKSFTLGFVLALICLLPPHAQTATTAPADSNAASAGPAPAAQAPDEVTNKISELVHAGKYAEAQQLTMGLLLAYPDDQRLIKAKALTEKLLAPGAPPPAALGRGQPPNNAVSALPAANPNAEPLTGMDKVDYDALIELARQAQRDEDLGRQKTLLKQFMTDSGLFLQKHPAEMLLWQLRAASAISLGDATAGYEAGQRLLTADSSDSNVRRLLAQLKNKGWLSEKTKRYGWILGTWGVSWSNRSAIAVRAFGGGGHQTIDIKGPNKEFSISDSVIEGYSISSDGVKSAEPDIRGTILDSGEIQWEVYLFPSGAVSYLKDGGDARVSQVSYREVQLAQHSSAPREWYPNGWQPVISCEIGKDKATMAMVVPSQNPSPKSKKPWELPMTLLFTRTGATQGTQSPPETDMVRPSAQSLRH